MPEARYKRQWRTIRRTQKALNHALEFYFTRTTPIVDPAMGKRLANARRVMGLSQTELGKKLNLSQSDIYRIESGKLTSIPLSMAQFKSALSDHFDYVFRGSLEHHYEDMNAKYNERLANKRAMRRNK